MEFIDGYHSNFDLESNITVAAFLPPLLFGINFSLAISTWVL